MAAFRAAGKSLDMGKSCVRFETLDDLALDAVAVIASASVGRLLRVAIRADARNR